MKNLKDVSMFRIPVENFILEKDFTIHIGNTEFLYDDNKNTSAETIYTNFFKGVPIKVKYDIDTDGISFVRFEIKYLKDEKMLEGKRL